MAVRKKVARGVKSKTGVIVESVYCRKCMETKRPDEFYAAVDYIDSNGYMSVCKECCNDIYAAFFSVESDIAKATLKACRKLNIKFDTKALDSAMAHLDTMEKRGTEIKNFFGLYKSKLLQSSKGVKEFDMGSEMTFVEPNFILPPSNPLPDNDKDSEELKIFWGDSLEYEDYVFLEKEFAEWKKTHKCDTKAEEMLLKEICHKSLEIRKKRKESRGVTPAHLTKELQELMKTASVDPAKTASMNSGKSKETFSEFIKIIEQTEPAEYFEDKKLFEDFDDIDFYFKKYVTRPLKNFITGSRDFNVERDDDDDDDFDMEEFVQGIEKE